MIMFAVGATLRGEESGVEVGEWRVIGAREMGAELWRRGRGSGVSVGEETREREGRAGVGDWICRGNGARCFIIYVYMFIFNFITYLLTSFLRFTLSLLILTSIIFTTQACD